MGEDEVLCKFEEPQRAVTPDRQLYSMTAIMYWGRNDPMIRADFHTHTLFFHRQRNSGAGDDRTGSRMWFEDSLHYGSLG